MIGMSETGTVPRAAYELPLPNGGKPVAVSSSGRASLPEALLLKNALWFCGLRWIVVGMLATFGLLGMLPNVLESVGLRSGARWPLAIAGVLAVGNVVFCTLVRRQRSATAHGARLNLWGQIVFDLVILTAVIHFVGSVGVSIAFAYLFHTVLACIFLSRVESLAVTLLACALYTGCVVAESAGIVAARSVFVDALAWRHPGFPPAVVVWNVGLALAICMAVWYLTSYLATMVRARDEELGAANRRLEASLEERLSHMLRTTHELKAPFAAIHATTQVLLDGQCGQLPEEAAGFLRRIATRCRRLANEIQEMVQLANLRSESQGTLPMTALDAGQVLAWCVGQVQPLAEERHVVIEARLHQAWTHGVEDHLKMLFTNVLGNAVAYSYEGGRVRVACGPDGAGGATATVEDRGIGIPAAKLPHIFEEYYRTDEAVRHNKQSSGLGLAVVRHVAQTHGIHIRVESSPGVGTTFHVHLPPGKTEAGADLQHKETPDGVRDDR